MFQNDADVIIIGAGHNSLAAALYLQKAGHSVLLLEQAKVPGGAAKTAALLEPGFTHDVYATNIGQFLGSHVYADFKEDLGRHGFEIVAVNQPFSSVFPGGKCIRVYTDPEKTLQEFEQYSPRDVQAWKDMIAYFSKIARHMFPILQLPIPSAKLLRHFWKIYRSLGRYEMLELLRTLLMPTRQFLDERYESDEAKALLCPWAFHLGLSPDCAGGATFSFLESAADHLNGLALAKGGVGRLINAMVAVLQEGGAHFLYGEKVIKVLVRGGKAVGVSTSAGNTYLAKKAVLANVTPQGMLRLVEENALPGNYVTRCKRWQYGPGTLMLHLTLDGPLQWEAAEDLSDSAYVHVGPYLADIASTYRQVMEGLLPSDPLLCVAQQSRHDSERAPAGKEVLWVQVRAFPRQPKGDALGVIKTGSWEKIKEPLCERIINKIAQYAPGIKGIVRKAVVHTPQDLEDDDPNLVGGDMVGGSHQMHQFFFFRPVPGWSRYKTPIKGFYLTGQSTWPGCGMNASAGHLAAMQMLKDRI